jgi:tetrahydromethanopterin S-methyltransferase subunit C
MSLLVYFRFRAHQTGTAYPLWLAFILCALDWLCCCWGVLKRRVGGHGLAFALVVINILGLGIGFILMLIGWSPDRFEMAAIIVDAPLNVGVLIWLVLPSVRAAYHREEQPA